jgi:phosphatidylglycerophosphatase A
VTAILFLVGWWCCKKIITSHKNKDPSEIVIDELVGQWISIIPIFYFLDRQVITFSSFPYLELIFAFIIFRIFDIVKIGPILWADNLKSGLGIMLDDCLAGCFTFLLMTLYLIII